MYGDEITKAMRSAIAETNRRRKVQQEYNEAHGIIPRSVEKKVGDLIEIALPGGKDEKQKKQPEKKLSKRDREAMIEKLTVEMKDAARRLDFELAAYLRDKIRALREDSGK
jgi:excinuclease ABC subunit B